MMGVREAVGALVVVVAAHVAAAPQDGITLTTNGYSGVTVAIDAQLDQTKCALYISSIKTMVEEASQLMFSATGNKAFFRDVAIVVPESWSCPENNPAETQLVYSWDSSHLRVGPSHYLFGDNPWTQQLGGCGEPGDWIYLPENFLLAGTDIGSPGRVLLHEWAKYRWGVFEEYGHAGDPIFPPAYRSENITNIKPTYCTNQLLEGDMSCPEGGTEAECQFIPDLTQNTTITSSLLAAPFLDTVNSFCDAGSHNTAAPTKHNLLCDQSSVMDVINRHADMKGNSIGLMNTDFTVVRAEADWPRMVLLVEYSTIMGQPMLGRWEQLRDNVLQFINVDAPADSYLGVVMFGKSVEASPLLLLTTDNRKVLAGYIYNDLPGPDQGKKNLLTAITTGAAMLESAGGGTLVLLTQSLEEYPATPGLVEAAANNPVWPILYPCDTQLSKEVYQQLADISPDTSVLAIQNTVFTDPNGFTYQSVDNSVDLHYNLLLATANPATRVAKDSCKTGICTIYLQMSDNTLYTSQAYIKVFFSLAEQINYVTITAIDPSGGNLIPVQLETNWVFTINSLQTGQYQVFINGTTVSTFVVELWATPAPLDLQVSVWSPQGLHNLLYAPGIAPRLLAKVTNSASMPVLFADVTAQVANKITPGTSVNIILNDGGTGADVTGQDGIYSGFLVGLNFEVNMDVTVTLTVTDNNGTAQVVNTTLRAAPTSPGNVACCGSQLDVSLLQLQSAGDFQFSSSSVSGRFTGEDPGTFPPGRVTDLQATRDGYIVTLTFTAPGGQLDQGRADWYEVKSLVDGESLLISNISGVAAGSPVEVQFELLDCDKVYTMTVVAIYNGVYGSTSNSVREVVSCNAKPKTPGTNLSGGQIAGIVIGCILAVLLILLIIYLCLNRDHLDDLWVYKVLTCRYCCDKSKDDDLYNTPSQARRSDVIRSNSKPSVPVRNLSDLYSRPNVGIKKESRQDRAQDEDDGGFGERSQRHQENVQRRPPEDVESLASSLSTLPINKVGLPVGSDNHGYDDTPYTIYRNAPPVPRYPRANTKV